MLVVSKGPIDDKGKWTLVSFILIESVKTTFI